MSEGAADATRSQLRGSTLLLAGQSFALAVNLAVQILIVRELSKQGYGAFAYALSVVMVGEAVAGFGMRRGVSRYVPLYEERGDRVRAAGTLVLALGTVLSLGLAVVLVVAGFRGAVAGSFADDSTAVTVLVLLSLLAPIQALSTLLDGVFAVFARPRSIVARKFVLTPLMRLAVVLLLAFSDEGEVFLAVGFVVTGVLGLGLYAPLLVRLLRERGLMRHLRPSAFRQPAREVLSFTVPLLSNDVTNALLTAASGIVLGILAAPQDVADLRAVLPVALTMGYVLSSFGLLLVPLASRMYARGMAEEVNSLYWRTAVWTSVLAFPIFLVCVALPEPLTVLLFGERYEDSAPILAVLAVGQFVNTAMGHNGVLLGVFGRVRFIALSNVAIVVVGLVLLVALVPPYEAVGAAVATTVTFVLLNLVRQVGLGRLTDVHALDREALLPYAALTGATLPVVAIQLVLSPPVWAGAVLVVAAIAGVGLVVRRRRGIADTFPEFARIPLVGRLVGGGEAGP